MSIDLAEELGLWPSYKTKLSLLSAVKGYSSVDDGLEDKSLIGKNLINLLHHCGSHFPSFACHQVASMSEHPDGPGAFHESTFLGSDALNEQDY